MAGLTAAVQAVFLSCANREGESTDINGPLLERVFGTIVYMLCWSGLVEARRS